MLWFNCSKQGRELFQALHPTGPTSRDVDLARNFVLSGGDSHRHFVTLCWARSECRFRGWIESLGTTSGTGPRKLFSNILGKRRSYGDNRFFESESDQ